MTSAGSRDVLIEVRELTREYRVGPSTVHALDGLDIDVVQGEFLVKKQSTMVRVRAAILSAEPRKD